MARRGINSVSLTAIFVVIVAALHCTPSHSITCKLLPACYKTAASDSYSSCQGQETNENCDTLPTPPTGQTYTCLSTSTTNKTSGEVLYQKTCSTAPCTGPITTGFCYATGDPNTGKTLQDSETCFKCCTTNLCNTAQPPLPQTARTIPVFTGSFPPSGFTGSFRPRPTGTSAPNQPSGTHGQMPSQTSATAQCFAQMGSTCNSTWQCVGMHSPCPGNADLQDTLAVGNDICGLSSPSSSFSAQASAQSLGTCTATALRGVVTGLLSAPPTARSEQCPHIGGGIGFGIQQCLFAPGSSVCDLSCKDLWTMIRILFWKQGGALKNTQSQLLVRLLQNATTSCTGKPIAALLASGTCLPVTFNDIQTIRLTAVDGDVSFSDVINIANDINAAISQALNLQSKGYSSIALPAFRQSDEADKTNRTATVQVLITPSAQLSSPGGFLTTSAPTTDTVRKITLNLAEAIRTSSQLQNIQMTFHGQPVRVRLSSFSLCRDPACSTKDPQYDGVTPAPQIVPTGMVPTSTSSVAGRIATPTASPAFLFLGALLMSMTMFLSI